MPDFEDYLKTERYPGSWCPGCGIGLVIKSVAQSLQELNIPKEKVTVVSGIGCTGRSAGYFNFDSVHGLHGRAVPLAEGIKRVRKDMTVIVISGDGDLLGIGGNHLLHAARRNIDLKIICNNNNIYGMTGGQKSPTTPKDVKTSTSPFGNDDSPLNVQKLIRVSDNFYARTTSFHLPHMKKCIKESFAHEGFSFVDIVSNCVENYGRRQGYKNAWAMLKSFKEGFKINSEPEGLLKDNELGILK